MMKALGIEFDDSTKDTPERVAKMYLDEIFKGLDQKNFPKIMTQMNAFNYDQMIIEANVSIYSVCEHHLIPMFGFAHVAYMPTCRLIGLSKINRVAQFHAARPQVQERLTSQIANSIKGLLKTEDVGVVLDLLHLCVRMRGVKDVNSITRTAFISGRFLHTPVRTEFYNSIPGIQDFKVV